jgi:tricorn protease
VRFPHGARCAAAGLAFLGLASACPAATRFLHDPDVHGDRLVFVQGNDLWLASIKGGTASRLTHDGRPKSAPRFSPDGRFVGYS